MIPYASRTGTKRNLDAMRDAGWGLLVSAAADWRTEGFNEIGADNGQWSERGTDNFDADRFCRFVDWLGDRARWLALPDIVEGGLRSLELTLAWLDKLRGHPSILLVVVQDGIEPHDVAGLLGPQVGLFVGGSTDWKLQTAEAWGQLAAACGCWLHIGRVNSAKRMFLAIAAGAHSVDGTSVSRFADTMPLLRGAALHQDLFAPRRAA